MFELVAISGRLGSGSENSGSSSDSGCDKSGLGSVLVPDKGSSTSFGSGSDSGFGVSSRSGSESENIKTLTPKKN